jgi:hypothetical protein
VVLRPPPHVHVTSFLRRTSPTVTALSLFSNSLCKPDVAIRRARISRFAVRSFLSRWILSIAFFVVKVVRRDLEEVILITSSGTWIFDGAIVRFLEVLRLEDRAYRTRGGAISIQNIFNCIKSPFGSKSEHNFMYE